MYRTVEEWVAEGYGLPLWCVRLLFELTILEARAMKRTVTW